MQPNNIENRNTHFKTGNFTFLNADESVYARIENAWTDDTKLIQYGILKDKWRGIFPTIFLFVVRLKIEEKNLYDVLLKKYAESEFVIEFKELNQKEKCILEFRKTEFNPNLDDEQESQYVISDFIAMLVESYLQNQTVPSLNHHPHANTIFKLKPTELEKLDFCQICEMLAECLSC